MQQPPLLAAPSLVLTNVRKFKSVLTSCDEANTKRQPRRGRATDHSNADLRRDERRDDAGAERDPVLLEHAVALGVGVLALHVLVARRRLVDRKDRVKVLLPALGVLGVDDISVVVVTLRVDCARKFSAQTNKQTNNDQKTQTKNNKRERKTSLNSVLDMRIEVGDVCIRRK